jgi:hypothetical protein
VNEAGWVAIDSANWSFSVAENCFVHCRLSAAVEGKSVIDVAVWFTVTGTELVAVSPAASVIIAVIV